MKMVRRRTLERRKYGGEGKVRGLESRRREGGAVVGSAKGEREEATQMTGNRGWAPKGGNSLNPRLIPLHLTV